MCVHKLLSLCIPTNGIIEWVFPVLDSIYRDKEDMDLFEVIVTDNGNHPLFADKMNEYVSRYSNLIYKKTDAELFLNQIEAFKIAGGRLIKFVNHRMAFLPGTLKYLVQFAQNHSDTIPAVYFLNGMLKLEEKITRCHTFDAYVNLLSYYSSWSGGTAIWKEDFEKIDLHMQFNYFFPHMDLIFSDRRKEEYIIDNTVLFHKLSSDSTKKGNYNLFLAFGVEFLNVIYHLLQCGYISKHTFEDIRLNNMGFLEELYMQYMILQEPCSYDLKGYRQYLNVYYSAEEICKGAFALVQELCKIQEQLEACIDTDKNVIIFGAGTIGVMVLKYFTLNHRKITMLVDNDKHKWGRRIQGIRIYSLEEGVFQYPEAIFIVANAGHELEMKDQLTAMGLDESRIVVCNKERLLQQMIQKQYDRKKTL